MAIAPLQLSQLGAVSAGADFSPLADIGKSIKAYGQQQTLANLGQGIADGTLDYKTAAAKMMSVNPQAAMSLANLGATIEQRQLAQANSERDFAFRQQESARAQRNADRSYGLQAQTAARTNRSPEETASQRAQLAGQYGIQPGTPEFKAFVLTGALPASSNSNVQAQADQRKAVAEQVGLTPDNPAYQSYVATGKMPREDAQPLTATDKKAIIEADEGVLAAETAIASLNRAKALSKDAYEGPTAGIRGYTTSLVGSKAGEATEGLTNEVMSNALSQLKSIFGSAPTEGERKILLDIQGSASKTDAVRQQIYDRAITMANRRLEFNKQRAGEMRGGTFYKPQGSMSRAPVQQTRGISQAEYEKLPSGSVFTAPDGTQRVKP